MLHETRLIRSLAKPIHNDSEPPASLKVNDDVLEALINGLVHSVLTAKQPVPARITAREMERNPEKAVDIAIADLQDVAKLLGLSAGNIDSIRDALVKRTQTICVTLTKAMQKHATRALMHIEHELLGRKYHSEETMYGDKVTDIPRDRFFVTQDGYAWDLVCRLSFMDSHTFGRVVLQEQGSLKINVSLELTN